MPIELKGKPIVITGASSGIGAATAALCAQAGMPVALLARRTDKLDLVAERIRAAGGRAITHPGSVDSPEDCAAILDQAQSEFGPVYSVFANAGYGQVTPTWSMSESDIRQMFETNFYGSLNIIRPALDGFIERGSGHIILCSSCLSKLAIPNYGCYSATKAAQDHFGRAMRLELSHTGVSVSTVHPIGTRTEFFETATKNAPDQRPIQEERSLQPPERVAHAILRQLRKDRGGEIWTSTSARLMFGFASTFPNLADRALARRMKKKPKAIPQSPPA